MAQILLAEEMERGTVSWMKLLRRPMKGQGVGEPQIKGGCLPVAQESHCSTKPLGFNLTIPNLLLSPNLAQDIQVLEVACQMLSVHT